MKGFKYARLFRHNKYRGIFKYYKYYKLINIMNKFLFLFFLSFIFVSCMTTKKLHQSEQQHQSDDTKNIEKNINENNFSNLENNLDTINKTKILSFVNQEKEYLTLQARVNINFPQITQTISASIELASTDSVLIKLYGPFGITVGKLYANRNFYIMNNNLENITFTGTPTANNLQKIINLPLDFDDIVYLLRSGLSNDTFKLIKIESEGELYFREKNNNGEFVLLNSLGQIINFQRKNHDDKLIISVKYSDFIKISNTNFAQKIFINFPAASGSATVEYTDIKISSAKNKTSLIFTKPQSYKLVELD